MEYKLLLPVKDSPELKLPHFPTRFHAAVFRLWETVDAAQIAKGLGVEPAVVFEAAQAMGLPEQKYTELWKKQGYLTIIRNMWHILPYDQLLGVLGWTEERLAVALKEDDFLWVKVGRFKPKCDPVKPEPLDENQKAQLAEIKTTMTNIFSQMFNGAKPFEFFTDEGKAPENIEEKDGVRIIFSYCGLYQNVLDEDLAISYPEELLEKYQSVGVNAIWLHVALYQVTPFTFDESYSKGWEQRVERLRELVERCRKYGIKVFIYLNEPRCMPMQLFEKYPQIYGRTDGQYGSMCTSTPEVQEYLRSSITHLCNDVPDIGGFFCIVFSENMTHCKSVPKGDCPRCKDIPAYKLAAGVISIISDASRKVNPDIKTMVHMWAADDYVEDKDLLTYIEMIPKEVIILTVSESKKKFTVGGIESSVSDYSMSVPGPSDRTYWLCEAAKKYGHEMCLKVQINNTWECSTVAFLPVFDLIREHMTNIRKADVEHLLLNWSLGGYPSVNLKIAMECLDDPSEEKYDELLAREFGQYASVVKSATAKFSDAFREFPFHISTAYFGPQNAGPSNLLYKEPTGYEATMTGFAYDDLDMWRSVYPRDVFINQLKLLSEKWKLGLDELSGMPDCEFKDNAISGYLLFYSSYLQSLYINDRDNGVQNKFAVEEEKKLAKTAYEIMLRNNTIGYEPANHYYFSKSMMIEKYLNCDYIIANCN